MLIDTTLGFDVLGHQAADELSVLVELTAPPALTGSTRAAGTLVVVLDRSGSMHGSRIEGAKTALVNLIDRLDPTDRFGLVVFDGQVDVVVPAGLLRDKAAVKRAVAAVQSRGNTDLSGGYLRGLQEAHRVAGAAGATVLLISDGHANAGITDPGALGGIAATAHADGVTTTTLGFGLGYDETLMSVIARGGHGNELFAEEADTAIKLIAGEVQGLLDQVAQAASLLVRPSPHVRAVRVVNDLPVAATDDGIMIELGSFYADESRKLVLTFAIPGIAALGLAEVASLEFSFVSLPDIVQHTVTVPLHVNVVPGDQAAGRLLNPTVQAEQAFLTVQRAKREASTQLSRGDVAGAAANLTAARAAAGVAYASAPAPYQALYEEEISTLDYLNAQVAAGEVSRAAKHSSADANRKSAKRGR